MRYAKKAVKHAPILGSPRIWYWQPRQSERRQPARRHKFSPDAIGCGMRQRKHKVARGPHTKAVLDGSINGRAAALQHRIHPGCLYGAPGREKYGSLTPVLDRDGITHPIAWFCILNTIRVGLRHLGEIDELTLVFDHRVTWLRLSLGQGSERLRSEDITRALS